MEGHSYVSCIKINGVPILPPMITKDIRKEMSDYKECAINIEKRLTALHIFKERNNDMYLGKIRKERKDMQCRKEVHSSKENLIPFEYKNGNYNETDIIDTNDVPVETFESSNENIQKSLQFNKTLNTKYKFENQTSLASGAISRSESLTTSVDTDHGLNETASTKSSITETASEIWKPQVPKTLNIIPLTLSNSNCKENKKYHEGDLDNIEDTPKLVRQGSYVLDTPSPILLAHMQMELGNSNCTPRSEYVPTKLCANKIHPKEWNVSQAKIEWECETKSKESIPTESFKSLYTLKGNSYSNTGRTMCKSISLQTRPKFSFAMYPSTRSVDCIQTMLVKEHTDRRNMQTNHDKKYTINNSIQKKQKLQTQKKCHSSSTVNSTCKLESSLEDLNEHNNTSIGNNTTGKVSSNVEIQDSTPKLKSSIASDKLLVVYKKVQDMHKKQMAELMSRQQREQILLQKEFEKQQLLLLTEIKKSFPEISGSLLSEDILSPAFDQIKPPNGDKCFENIDNNTQNIKTLKNNLQHENKVEHSQDDDTKIVLCPLDYIYSDVNFDNAPCSTNHPYVCQSLETELLLKMNNCVTKVEKNDTEIQPPDIKNDEEILLIENDECKRSNVSRELFPLDSKTTHVPILDRTIYTTKHIKAATIINAYVRGYLVRRIMRTERVIALKNTYKEALHCMLKLHVDAPLNRSEFNFLHRLQLQCDAASMNIVELFAQNPQKRMQVIAQDREIKQSRIERPTSARSYSFATQRTLARKKLKEMEEYQPTSFVRSCLSRSRCQTWTSDVKERLISSNILYHSIKRSTSAGTVRKPWR
ncbi:Centriolar coiled-coil protein of 110 kDa [Anthophora retusa]